MRFSSSFVLFITTATLFAGAVSKEVAPDPALAEIYESGSVHNQLMERKAATHTRQRKAGAYDSRKYKKVQKYQPCVNGFAGSGVNSTFACNNIDLHFFLSHADLGSNGEGSSVWGWTSRDGREFVAAGQADGAAFVEVNADGTLDYIGRLPQQSVPSIWREIRVYKDYAIIGSEAVGHGIQIFDLKKLLEVRPRRGAKFTPKVFNTNTDLTSLFTGLPVGRTHNVVVNEEMQYVVSVGAQPRTSECKSGLIFIDLKDPANPTSPGCAAQDGYVHDAQCLPYRGPDKRYKGRDICYGYNEDTLTIYDVTNHNATSVISRTSYEGAAYTHQGWVLDTNDQKFLIMDDELDEADGTGPGGDGYPVSFLWDIQDLENPRQTGHYKSKVRSIDHNQYIVGKRSYQSNYGAGLRILDLSSVERDPTGAGIKEIGFFDIYPEDDAEGLVDFVGTWGNYPFFKSGWIIINTIERGLFSVRYNPGGKK